MIAARAGSARRAGRSLVAALLALAWTAGVLGCATANGGQPVAARTPTAAADSEALWRRYEQAVDAARIPGVEGISTALVAIREDTPSLRWDEGRVLMVTWSKAQYWQTPYPAELTRPTWLTAVPFVQAFCRGLGQDPATGPEAVALRLKQRLGLKPDADYDAFVELWIDPRAFFRPCPDPEVTDRECQVSLAARAPAADGCPWEGDFEAQVSKSFVDVSADHLGWMCGNWTSTYPPGKPRESYPWTALGYTYDWSDPARPFGESEFVAPQGTPIEVRGVTPTEDYCRAVGPGGS